MTPRKQNWLEEWQGLEPEQPQSGRCGCWLGALVLLLALIATCIGTGYFAWKQLDLPLDPASALARATIPPLASIPAVDEPLLGTREAELVVTPPALAPTVTLPGTRPVEATNDIEVRFQSAAPGIDGFLDEWAGIPAYESGYLVYNAADWDGTDDVNAVWRLGWDGDNLYVAVQVRDDVHVQTERGDTIFRGDSLSIQFDTQLSADEEPRLSPDDFQIDLSPGDFAGNPVSVVRFRGDNSGAFANSPGHTIRAAAQQSVDGYIVEAAIPWRDLAITPSNELRLGIALNVNDNDSPGTAVQEVMKSHVATRRYSDPTSWGTLILSP